MSWMTNTVAIFLFAVLFLALRIRMKLLTRELANQEWLKGYAKGRQDERRESERLS